MRSIRCVAVLALALAACSSDAPPAGGGKPPAVTLLAHGLALVRDRPVVLAVDAATPSATVVVAIDPATRVDVYLLASAADALPAAECPLDPSRRDRSCVAAIGAGVRETLQRPGRAGAVAVVLRAGPERADVRVEYDAAGRAVGLRLPRLDPPPGASVCKDNGCNPFLEMMPQRAGSFEATASFSGGPARLQIQSGRVIAKSFTATGVPYRIPAEDAGASPLSASTRFDAPAEYALAFLNENPSLPATDIVIEARWP